MDKELTPIVTQIAMPIFSKNASQGLKSLESIFYELNSVYQLYTDFEHSNDFPFWYYERTHVGFLAAAVWRSGGTALLEFLVTQTKSEDIDPTKGKENQPGRWCDLYIKTKDQVSFDCEAKRRWFAFKEKAELDGLNELIDRGLKEAENQILQLTHKKGLALCFVVLATPTDEKDTKNTVVSEQREHFIKWYDSQKNDSKSDLLPCDALVWISIAEGCEPIGADGKFKYLGMLLAVKEVH